MKHIIPIEKENIGIRAEMKYLCEKMDRGFAETSRTFQMMNEKMERGFSETDKRILLMNEQMNKRFAYMERLQLSMLGCLIALLVKFLFFTGSDWILAL